MSKANAQASEYSEDAVDQIKAAWLRERPELDVSSIGIVTRIWRIGRHLERAREQVLEEFRTDSIVVDVLAELRRSGEPYRLTAGDLRESSKLSSGGVSQRLARLERSGLLTRDVDPDDRRVVNVELTAAGMVLIDAIVDEITKRESELLEQLGAEDCGELEKRLAALLSIFE